MALSAAMQWALANGMTEADVYKNINDFLATNPDAATTQAQMAQYGISPQDVAAATGGASGGLLSGNIMAGASWNSTNTALQDALTQATGQQTSNYAVGGSTTTDTLNQLNKFLAGGGQFDPNATVYLQAGGVDFIQGVDKGVVKDNLNQIVKTLGDQGVNVVLTGSPYAKSVEDVINNNFDPKVDQIFNDVAKANSNVALVGTQGEILQNKKLLVDALHTNAEGTAIYNQSVIDALSQFKNEVPPSTPQAIAEVQKTNTVATTPPVITQAAENKVAVQDQLKNQILSQGTTSQWQGEGKGSAEANAADMAKILADAGITDISQFGKVTKAVDVQVQPVYDYKEVDYGGEAGVQLAPFVVGYTDQNGNAIDPSLVKTDTALVGSGENVNYETVYTAPIGKEEVFGNKLTGQAVTNTYGERQTGDAFGGTYTGKGNTAYNVQFDESGKPVFYTTGASSSDTKDIARIIQAGLLLSGAGGALGGALGLTGAAAQGVGTGLISAGTSAIGGANLEDALKTGLLSGGLVYGGNELANAIKYQDVPVDFTNMTQDQINDALDVNFRNDLARAGLTDAQIKNYLANPASVYDATQAVTTPTAVTTPVTEGGTVAVTAPTTPTYNTLNTVTGLLTPPTVTVAAPKAPEQIDQSVMNLINSQLATSVKTPTTLANVQVTGDKGLMSNADATNAILSTLAGVSTPTTVPTPNQTITAQKPATQQELVNAITAALPNVSQAQAATVAEQVITSGKNITAQDAVTALTAALPVITSPTTTAVTPTQTITGQKPVTTTQDLVNTLTAALPSVTTPTTSTVPTQTITAPRPTITPEAINTIAAALPTLTAPTTTTVPTQTITAPRPVVTPEAINTIAAAIPTVTTPTTTTPTTDPNKKNELGLTDAQMLALLQGGLGLLGGLGGASLLSGGGGGTSVGIGTVPTQQPPMYTGDYFTKVQQNYNQLLPAVPRDVASPLRDWYLSQYGA